MLMDEAIDLVMQTQSFVHILSETHLFASFSKCIEWNKKKAFSKSTIDMNGLKFGFLVFKSCKTSKYAFLVWSVIKMKG